MRWRILILLLTIVPCGGRAARADDDELDLSELTIEELLQVIVETPTKEPQPAREAPAVVSVISRDDIRAWGFHSVAEALVLVPGLYCIDDDLTADCGVRGINGGERGYSRPASPRRRAPPATRWTRSPRLAWWRSSAPTPARW